MPLTKKPNYIHEPTPLQCGQAVLAMLTDETVETVVPLVGTERETKLKDMFYALERYGISVSHERKEAGMKESLPPVCLLSLETPHCWHWSLYFKGAFYDPEYGMLSDFPPCKRKYYFEIFSDTGSADD